MTNPTATVADPFFRDAARQHVAEYVRHFGDRLVAVYVWGSVHRGEAVPGVSDLDLHAFIRDTPSPADEEWFQRERHGLEARFPETKGLSRPLPVASLLAGIQDGATVPERAFLRALGFRLCHDATLLWGINPLPDLAALPAFDAEFGRQSFESARDLARFAAGRATVNETDFDLPDEPGVRLRKLARLAVLGGGWYLVANGRLLSLCGADVLPATRSELPEWDAFLDETARLYVLPLGDEEASLVLASYTIEVARWTGMLGERLGMRQTD